MAIVSLQWEYKDYPRKQEHYSVQPKIWSRNLHVSSHNFRIINTDKILLEYFVHLQWQ